MEADIAGFDHEHKRGGGEQPERGGDSMYVDDHGYGRLLMEVVMQIKAEADAYEDPEEGEPDQRGPAIFTRGPGCGCVDLQSFFPLAVRKTYSNGTDAMKLFCGLVVIGCRYSKLRRFSMFIVVSFVPDNCLPK